MLATDTFLRDISNNVLNYIMQITEFVRIEVSSWLRATEDVK